MIQEHSLETLDLEQLRENLDFMTPSKAGWMCDCAVMRFHEENHRTGVNLLTETDKRNLNFSVTWTTEISKHLIESTYDDEETTEKGAEGVALLLVRRLTGFPYISRSRKGGGFDYGLSREPDEFSYDARLEVSGIKRKNASNNIESRLKDKKKQTKLSDNTGIPVFIAITEFSEPKTLFIQK